MEILTGTYLEHQYRARVSYYDISDTVVEPWIGSCLKEQAFPSYFCFPNNDTIPPQINIPIPNRYGFSDSNPCGI